MYNKHALAQAGVAQWQSLVPKLVAWVRFPSPAPVYDAGWSSQVARRAHNPEVAGSNPAPATNFKEIAVCGFLNTLEISFRLPAHVAQAAERILGKDKATGSNPVVSSMAA